MITGRGSLSRAWLRTIHVSEMALTIVEARAITGGVDTHADTHVAAALDPVGGLLGVREFPATPAGYAGLLGWLGGFGTVCLVGIEGTGSYGAGLTRHVTAAGVRVVEVDRSDRQDRRRQGKSDPVPLEYSIEWLTCTFASRLDVVLVSLPGAAQDRLLAYVPGIRPGGPGVPRRPSEGC